MASRRPLVAALAVVLAAAALGGLALSVPALHDALRDVLHGDTEALRDRLRELGVWGAVVLVALVLVHNVVPYPAEIALAVAGYVYGFWIGVPLMVVAWLLSALLGWALGRWLGRPVAHALFGRRRVAQADRLIARGGAFALLAGRLVPVVPFTLLSVVAGALHVPVARFAWTSAVGFLPLTVAVVLLGQRLEHLSPTDPVLWGVVVLLLGFLVAARPVLRRIEARAERLERASRREPAAAAADGPAPDRGTSRRVTPPAGSGAGRRP